MWNGDLMQNAFETLPKEFISEAIFYDHKDSITSALERINMNGAVVVMKGKAYYGIVDDRSIARKGATTINNKFSISKFARRVPLIDNMTTIEKTIGYFYDSGSKALPYMENNKIVGVVRRDTMLKVILSLHLLSKYKVYDVMSAPLVAIGNDATLSEAKTAMQKNRINRLIVTSDTKVSGILTYRSLLDYVAKSKERASKLERYVLMDTKVDALAEKDVHSIDYGQNVEDAVRGFIERKISSLLVTRAGNPIGIITIRDVFAAIATRAKSEVENITISGLDDYTQEYGNDIINALRSMDDKINKFHNLKVVGMALNIKRSKTRNYELKLRVWLEKRGAVSAHSRGYTLQSALDDVLKRVYDTVKDKKEIIYMDKKRLGKGGAEYESE